MHSILETKWIMLFGLWAIVNENFKRKGEAQFQAAER
jgi:hypothetical protein